jgi:hypothetical protein
MRHARPPPAALRRMTIPVSALLAQ